MDGAVTYDGGVCYVRVTRVCVSLCGCHGDNIVWEWCKVTILALHLCLAAQQQTEQSTARHSAVQHVAGQSSTLQDRASARSSAWRQYTAACR